MGTDDFDTIKIDLRVVALTIMVVCLTSEKCLVFGEESFYPASRFNLCKFTILLYNKSNLYMDYSSFYIYNLRSKKCIRF